MGLLFCITGIFLFSRNVFEEQRGTRYPVLLMLGGVILISIATAKFLHLA